jgi:glycosyltransferase involved in cell wall biosynthesis
MSNDFTPVFYSRGFNAPFTEGHVQILRMIVKSLSLQNIQSVVFNYRYDLAGQKSEQSFGENAFWRFEQKTPFLRREEVISASERKAVAWASLFETIGSLRFMFVERSITKHRRIVNITNCFRYPRLLAKKVLRAPVLLHFYKKDASNHVRTLIGMSDSFIVTSNSIATYLMCDLDVPRDKIRLVYPPIDTNLFKPLGKEYSRNVLRLPQEDKVILYIGNLNDLRFPEKLVLDVLKDLAGKYSRVVLQIHTSRSSENARNALQIERRAKSLGLSKHVKIQTRDLSDLEKSLIYNSADVFFFPSKASAAFVEPPLSVLEAMSTGTPTVFCNIPSLNELLDGKNKDLFAASKTDVSSYCEKLDQVFSKSDIATKCGIELRATIVRNASLDVVGPKLCVVYRSLLA